MIVEFIIQGAGLGNEEFCTDLHFVDYIKGEKGVKGDQGTQGVPGERGFKGDIGDTGAPGQDGINGNNGTNGIDGKSAYELAVIGGYTGTLEQFTVEVATIANNSARLATAEQGIIDFKSHYLAVTVTGTHTTPIYTFTKANFDAVSVAINNGAPIFVKFIDNRIDIHKKIPLSGIYPAVWNSELSQVEVQSPNIARGFYLNGVTPAHRGCVSIRSLEYYTVSLQYGSTYPCLFNSITGYYELGELRNLSESDLFPVVAYSTSLFSTNGMAELYVQSKLRTTFLMRNVGAQIYSPNCIPAGMFYSSSIEQIILSDRFRIDVATPSIFRSCSKLRWIKGVIVLAGIGVVVNKFQGCTVLEEVSINGVQGDISLSDSPLLIRDSVIYLLTNRANAVASPITITVHPTVYAWAIADSEIQALLPANATQGAVILASV